MKVTMTGRKVSLRDSLTRYVEKKLAKFDRFFDDDAQADVTVSPEGKNDRRVEITIRSGGMLFRAEEVAPEAGEAVDRLVDILTRQIRRNKTRLEKRLRVGAFGDVDFGESIEEETEFSVVRSKHFPVKPMDVDEAILQMNLLGHQFYMFRNSDTREINVVYRRHDGNYGLLEPGE